VRPRSTGLALAILLSIIATPSLAQIFRCEGPDGVVEYTNAPSAGPQGSRECRPVQSSITVIPAPKLPPRPAAAAAPASPASPAAGQPGGGAAPAAAPSAARPASSEGFPKVDPAAQRARDSDRRRILEDEQKKEEAKLAELRAEFNNGEPERRGDERNYQKYLDRVQRLREDIARSEGNLAAIRKELSLLRN
jgi:hypothetical protein